MRKNKTLISVILLFVTIISIGFYVYMLARPISYGMNYHNEVVYEGVSFEGNLKFYPDGTMVNKNTNFEEEMKSYYYYKNGYVLNLMAETEDEYNAEVANINENFEEAVASPFYAAKINAFRQVATEGLDSYVTTYTCTGAVIFAAVGGVVELVLIGLTCASFVLLNKTRN